MNFCFCFAFHPLVDNTKGPFLPTEFMQSIPSLHRWQQTFLGVRRGRLSPSPTWMHGCQIDSRRGLLTTAALLNDLIRSSTACVSVDLDILHIHIESWPHSHRRNHRSNSPSQQQASSWWPSRFSSKFSQTSTIEVSLRQM